MTLMVKWDTRYVHTLLVNPNVTLVNMVNNTLKYIYLNLIGTRNDTQNNDQLILRVYRLRLHGIK